MDTLQQSKRVVNTQSPSQLPLVVSNTFNLDEVKNAQQMNSDVEIETQYSDDKQPAFHEESTVSVAKSEMILRRILFDTQQQDFTQQLKINTLSREAGALKKANVALLEDNRKLQIDADSTRRENILIERRANELVHALGTVEASFLEIQQQSCQDIDALQKKLKIVNSAVVKQKEVFDGKVTKLGERQEKFTRQMSVNQMRIVAALKKLDHSENCLRDVIQKERQVRDQLLYEVKGRVEVVDRLSLSLREENLILSDKLSRLIQDNRSIATELEQLKRMQALAEGSRTNTTDAQLRRLKKKYKAAILKEKSQKEKAVQSKLAAENKVQNLDAQIMHYRSKCRTLHALLPKKETIKFITKELDERTRENYRLKDTVTMLRKEMEELNCIGSETVFNEEKSGKMFRDTELQTLTEQDDTPLESFEENQHLVGLSTATKKRDTLEQNLEEVKEELVGVLQDRESLLALSNRLRVDLQRKWNWQPSYPDDQNKNDGIILEISDNDALIGDCSGIKLLCQPAPLNIEKWQQNASLTGKSSDRATQSQKASRERMQRRQWENMKYCPNDIAKVRNWNLCSP